MRLSASAAERLVKGGGAEASALLAACVLAFGCSDKAAAAWSTAAVMDSAEGTAEVAC